MKTAIVVLNFGEPSTPERETVVRFLERIFFSNASLEHLPTEEARRARSRELAERRAPGLMEEYEEIGGSPLNAQADAQAEALARELDRRGHDVAVYSAYQFIEPLIEEVAERAIAEGAERIVGLPIYPLCGHSTNVAALNQLRSALDRVGGDIPLEGVTGWHRHPLYLELRADAVRRVLDEHGLDLADPGTRLVFSAHGTPRKYLDGGSGYQRYVEEFCREMAELTGAPQVTIGYQNHANRGIEWTQPDVETVIREIEARTVVVDPVSFMHEQSETLAELDHELREEAEERGLRFVRVPVPHDDPRFARVMADLVEPLLDAGTRAARTDAGLRFAPCRCRPEEGTWCLNNLPRSEAASSPSPAVAGPEGSA